MKEECINMTSKELTRLEVMQRVKNKEIKQKNAAEMLNLSIRQTKRLFKEYKKYGAKGLVSKKRCSKSNHILPQDIKQKAITLILKNYIDFGPTLIHEKLTEKHDLKISISSVRNIMIANDIWHPKKTKKRRIYQLRERRRCYGELIQLDGSPHDWFEGRAPKCTLPVYIDDATGKLMELRFVKSETTWNYMQSTKNYLIKHGRPIAFYSDKHGVFKVNHPSLKKEQLTQFGRALKQLEIELICANTPQAKGRVERANKTLQDRLPKELRLLNISTVKEANDYLPSFVKEYNKRFSKVAKSSIKAHRSINYFNLDKIFSLQNTRYLSKNLTLQYQNTIYQIKTSRPGYALRKAAVNIIEKENGEIFIEYKGQNLKYTKYHEQPYQGEVIPSKLLNQKIDQIKNRYKPSGNHPWKSYYPRKSLCTTAM